MIEVDGVYRTSDMLLTSVLHLYGYDHKMERVGRHKVVWYFDPPSSKEEDFNELVDRYEDQACRLEPHELMRSVRAVRLEMYAELGENAPKAEDRRAAEERLAEERQRYTPSV